ncbi:hypothetical protein GH714_014890 [Hevea brasiliensis]|uniref:Uncharacterized protein n=1 Tax=Hevea brasiliensis TaxID=3981 RepID=A0A6A6KRH6_HEVBR|nr:hypothetical protein GH714_014890 [Hevea brasiliensis]
MLTLEAAPVMHQASSVVASGLRAEYIVEENDGEEGCSLDGKHLYCKRRAPEDKQLGVGLVLALETTPVMHQSSSVAASDLELAQGQATSIKP